MKAAFHTLGCKVNQYETERMKEQFLEAGFDVVGEDEVADCYIINTCTVTNLADRKSRQYIRRMKKQAPNAVVAVTGCYSQVAPEELEAMPEVDIVTGNGEKNKLIDLVQGVIERKASESSPGTRGTAAPEKVVHVLPYDELTEYNDRGIITAMEGRTRAYIKIQEGCDRFCAYCLIPFARGHVRSRDPEEIITEARTLVEQGFKEIVLTGINTALYGTEDGFENKFPGAQISSVQDPDKLGAGMEYIISQINDIPGEFRIRLSSLEPTVVNSGYVERLMKYEKLCPHLHLSIQSGSDKVIGLMNRHYTRDEYLDIVRILRAHDPGYGITTDIIVGFPGEEEENFMDSCDMVERVEFSKVHIFKYSKRRGTVAEGMKDQVSGEVKNTRSDRLEAVSDEAQKAFFGKLKGTVRTVLFEEIEDGFITGWTDNYVKVYVENEVPSGSGNGIEGAPENVLNKLVKVKFLDIFKDGMKGEIANG